MPSKQPTHQSKTIVAEALQLQTSPPVYVVALSGKWLLQHTTPSWRIKDPIQGFQRIVNEDRAKQIARTVLDRERAFPNAITLASDIKALQLSGNNIILPEKSRFLVVDGQHRLWAQRFSNKDAQYACIIHLNKTEKEMAELFLEINDNQRRVPSSLRWDLVRLVKPEGDEAAIMASELVLALVERQDSPFYIAIDLTGEQKDVSIKQGSLAPEIKTLITRTRKVPGNGFEEYATLLIRFFSAVRSLDPNGWGDTSSTYYKARVLRALIRVLIDLVLEADTISGLSANVLLRRLKKIDPTTLSEEKIRAAQGSAGVTDLYQCTSDGKQLRPSLQYRQREKLMNAWYHPHHRRLAEATQRALDRHGRALLIDAHSFPSSPLPYELDQRLDRPDICIGTDKFHTPPQLEEAFLHTFGSTGWTVRVNTPFAGVLVPMSHYRKEHRLAAVMIEANRALYVDESTGKRLPCFTSVARTIRQHVVAAISRLSLGDYRFSCHSEVC